MSALEAAEEALHNIRQLPQASVSLIRRRIDYRELREAQLQIPLIGRAAIKFSL